MINFPNITIAILPIFGIFEINHTTQSDVIVTGGYEYEFLQLILKGLKIPYRFVYPDDLSWGVELEDGNFTGLLGMIVRNETDFAMGGIFLTEERMSVADCSYPYSTMEVTFVTNHPSEIHSALTFVYPFTLSVWICLTLTIIILPFVFKVIQPQNSSLISLVFDVFASMFGQPMLLKVSSFRSQVLILSWLLAALLISHSYSSLLLSFLTIPLQEQGVKDISSLSKAVSEGKMKAFMSEGNSIYSNMLQHKDPSVRLLTKNIIKNEWFLKPDSKLIRHAVLNEKNAFIEIIISLRDIFSTDAFISKDILYAFPLTILVRRNFVLKEKINKLIRRLAASGIYNKNVNDYMFQKHIKIKKTSKLQDPVQKITLKKLKGAFIILAIGLGLSLIVFLIEVLCYK